MGVASGVLPPRHPPTDSNFWMSSISTSCPEVFPLLSRSIATSSGISPGLGKICRGALDVVDGNECRGVTSSDPGLNNLVVSYTKTGPCVRPTTILLSKAAKQTMFGIAGASERVLWGLNTFSAFSGVASWKAARRSVKREKTRARSDVR